MSFSKLMITSLIVMSFVCEIHAKDKINGFELSIFYKALSLENIESIDAQLKILETVSLDKKEAYEGTLMMKKAGLLKNVKEKLKLFNAGRLKLESSISKDTSNTELHFLRLIIQENAPRIINYRNDIENDNRKIQSGYKKLSPDIQKAVMDYRKKSKYLKEIVN